ncbi:hypothetical protein MKZ38_005927 [Zalerion maritima]|uniref:Uncharacterized protein n=1 Tax=Zalerion maritima TaxID=339359 RepID=A0AAD5RXN7_9PEZI|nr:hypothetical protein MKZ38_005927 [Zalerion maritima]
MASPNLADLPVELQREVCRKLCTHCEGISDFRQTIRVTGSRRSEIQQYDKHILRYRESTRTLSSLSRVSRHFNIVAQPFLYHCVRLENASKRDMQKPIPILPLARTLLFRLDLGRHVRELTVMGWDAIACLDTWLDPAWEDIWAEAVERGLSPDLPWGVWKTSIKDPWAVIVRGEVDARGQFERLDGERKLIYQRERFLLQLILACCPKLQVLNLGDRQFDDWYKFVEPDFFPRLVGEENQKEFCFPHLRDMTIYVFQGRESPRLRHSMLNYLHQSSPRLDRVTVIWPVTSMTNWALWLKEDSLATFRRRHQWTWAFVHSYDKDHPTLMWEEQMSVDPASASSSFPFYDLRCLRARFQGDVPIVDRTFGMQDNQGDVFFRINVNSLGSGTAENALFKRLAPKHENCQVIFRSAYADIYPWNLQSWTGAPGTASQYFRQICGSRTVLCEVGKYSRVERSAAENDAMWSTGSSAD